MTRVTATFDLHMILQCDLIWLMKCLLLNVRKKRLNRGIILQQASNRPMM